jgi:hypothetical protein
MEAGLLCECELAVGASSCQTLNTTTTVVVVLPAKMAERIERRALRKRCNDSLGRWMIPSLDCSGGVESQLLLRASCHLEQAGRPPFGFAFRQGQVELVTEDKAIQWMRKL